MMPTMSAREWARRFGPEAFLAVLAVVVFLGFLGSVELWGKREQRASAEAIDTIDHGHWLVAQIQGRPRLEKPPLPRWTIALLMGLTGRRDEWMVRLPNALAALGMVGLVYGLGRRLGGREVGLASGLALTSLVFFIVELRQAGNDGPLALFTTLALYAAWRRLHGAGGAVGDEPGGTRGWNLVFYAALGLGFLTKGPIIVALVALTLVPYLATVGRFRAGVRHLADGRGWLLFLLLALSWPVPVWLNDPNAVKVWLLEMGQKTGTAGIAHHRQHEVLAADWFWLTAPWVIPATMAVSLPCLPRGRSYKPRIWFPWSWAVANMAMFCLWTVAKPNYYLPCLPGVALLIGIEWVRLTRTARDPGARTGLPRRILQFHWVMLFAGALVAPVAARQLAPQEVGWIAVFSATVAVGAVASAWAWHRGADAGALAPLVAAWAVAVLAVYGGIGPAYNPAKGHRALAATIERMVPPDERTVMFFEELDEGLWFYLRDRTLAPVPGSQPKYNKGFDMDHEFRDSRLVTDPERRKQLQARMLIERKEKEVEVLRSWLQSPERTSSYLLMRDTLYDRLSGRIAGLAAPIHREQGVSRHGMVLLHVNPPAPGPVATDPRRAEEARRQ
ncbi:MAG: ArnT family glycosyltransferase [Planctomycetaceae bacterium]